MSTWTVFQQMLIIIILILVGYGVYKKGFIGKEGAQDLSFLVLNITNPAFVISTAFSDEITITHRDILLALLLTFVIYIVLIIFGNALPYLLRTKKSERKFYSTLSVYSNVGFIGIPVASAVLGPNSLIYVALFNVVYTLFFYTHGYISMLKGVEGADKKISVKSFINIGTVAAVIAILIFWFDIKLPMVLEDTAVYIGRATTFIAMIVLGITFAELPLKKLLGNVRIYIMVALRYLACPVVVTLIFKSIFGSNIMVQTIALMLAMPAGNSPLMLATRYDMETDTMSSGILVSTLFSVITVTLTSMVL